MTRQNRIIPFAALATLLFAFGLCVSCSSRPNGLAKTSGQEDLSNLETDEYSDSGATPWDDPNSLSGLGSGSGSGSSSNSGGPSIGDPELTDDQEKSLTDQIANDIATGVKPLIINGQPTLFPSLAELARMTPEEMFVFYLYRQFLGRNPEAGGLKYWTDKLKNGGTAAQVIAGILGSDEFYKQFGSDIGWVSGLYYFLLGRAADAGGMKYWLNALKSGMTRYTVVMGFLNSPEFIGLSRL